ncbi:MAG: hypothetical protein AB1486_32310 [Planctomycetota bacterium]
MLCLILAVVHWFRGVVIPISPIHDSGAENPYPLQRIAPRRASTNTVRPRTDVAMPVSMETDCRSCHATGGIAAADAGITWSSKPDLKLQAHRNVLILRHTREGTQVQAGQLVVCSRRHYSAPLDLARNGPGRTAARQADLLGDRACLQRGLRNSLGQPIFLPGGSALETCYQCHPRRITECQRDAMKNGGMRAT